MSTIKSTPKKLTRTRRHTKLDKILAWEVPKKQKNIRTARDSGSAPQKKARDILAMTPKKKKKTGKPQYIVRDDYFYEAKRLGYRARSAFKLLDIQEKYNIIRTGMKVLDIASAPGSWLQVLAKMVGPTGIIAGVDIQKIEGLGYQNVHVFQGDVFVTEPIIEFLKGIHDNKETSQKRSNLNEEWVPKWGVQKKYDEWGTEWWVQRTIFSEVYKMDCITSDIAAHTTGQTGVDQYRSVELNLAILDIADIFLRKWGTLVLKVFVGEDIDDLIGPIKARYTVLHKCKPKACRERSFEEYFVCQGKKD
ncbi:MAG: hypothetical protein ACD_78C00439G0002 [uncultured bacterium (gcode 4)]|uniref:Ribosomal RNA large subunit methyltransferase E n=1 Tax=uncultured bacterium (gcode 4) TaxID=1234023 RepID=K1YVP7_9BACT|nr:MAG: hypothetical protein ACD_78C00439G0002 [uncultured bacterium (gcode 4)]